MNWAGVMKINGNMFKSLDQLGYDILYNLALVMNGGYGETTGDVVIIPDGKDDVSEGEYASAAMRVVVLPRTVKKIGTRAFDQCANLEAVVIPEGLEIISGFAFRACTNLKSVRLPASITTINSLAFQGDTSLENILVPWGEGEIEGAPWGATNATIYYNAR